MHNAVQASGQVAQNAGQSAASPAEATGQLSSLVQQPMQMVSSATEPLKQMLQGPMQAMQGVTSLPQSMMQGFGGMFPAAGAPSGVAAAEPAVAAAGMTGSTGGGVGGAGGLPGAGLTSYTRPTSSFEPEAGGKPTSLRAGVLNAAEVRGPTVSSGGTPLPMTPAGMLARGEAGRDADKDVLRARVVVDPRENG